MSQKEIEKSNLKRMRKIKNEFPSLALKLNDFEIAEVIGKGGFGQVRISTYKKDNKKYAIKEIFENRLTGNQFKRFLGEIKTMASCNNQFLLELTGFTYEPPYSIITPYIPNGSLWDYMFGKYKGKLTNLDYNRIAIGIASGMAHIHSLGIIHRDLKGGNILIDENNLPKICDFGIARFGEDENIGMTKGIGTPIYMAPELVSSTSYTTKVDVYSFAMILYEMSERKPPFKKMDLTELRNKVILNGERPIFTKNTPHRLQKLISSCWIADPDQRPSFIEIYNSLIKSKALFKDVDKEDINTFNKFINSYRPKPVPAEINKKPLKPVQIVPEIPKQINEEISNSFISNPYNNQQITFNFPNQSNFVSSFTSNYFSPPSPIPQPKTENTDPASIILSNYNDPNFEKYIKGYSKTLEPKYFQLFSNSVLKNFEYQCPSNIVLLIVDSLNSMMKRDNNFIPLIANSKYFSLLPFYYEECLDLIVDSYSFLFLNFPESLKNPLINNRITELLEKRTEKILILYSYLFSNPLNISQEMITILFNCYQLIRDHPASCLLLRIINYLASLSDQYKTWIISISKPIFFSYINSLIPETIIDSYKCILHYCSNYDEIDFSILFKHLKVKIYSKYVISLLVRINFYHLNLEILPNLFILSREFSITWYYIFNLASTFLIQFPFNNDFIINEIKIQPNYIFKLFLILFSFQENRNKFLKFDSYYLLLNDLILLKNQFFLKNIHSIIHRQNFTDESVLKLSNSNFLINYINYVFEQNSIELFNACIVILYDISPIIYLPEYKLFYPKALELFNHQQLFDRSLSLISLFSTYKEISNLISSDNNIINYIQSLLNYPQYQYYAQTILNNLK